MPYCSNNYTEESLEQKIIRKKDREIEILKDVIVNQAKEQLDAEIDYQEVLACNSELRDARDNLRRESNEMFEKVAEIKDLLRTAKECADDTTKSQHQREVSEIRVELLQDVLDILEGNENEDIKTGTESLKK